jgi:hypothetical protein
MNSIRVETVVQNDGELFFANVPCHKGERVEAILLLPEKDAEKARAEALLRFTERALRSNFRSVGPYPTREELHERR